MRARLVKAVLLVAAVTLTGTANAQVLVSSEITFITPARICINGEKQKGDDKDDDTKLLVWLKDGTADVARLVNSSADRTTFADNGSQHSYRMTVLGQPFKFWMNVWNMHIHIHPNGHDTWKFHVRLVLRFSDGTIVERRYGGIKLSEQNRSINLHL
jgi:hypothetical protein